MTNSTKVKVYIEKKRKQRIIRFVCVIGVCTYIITVILWLYMYGFGFYINDPITHNIPSSTLEIMNNNDPISICSFNNTLCKHIHNPICKYLLPPQVVFSRQHKTGTMLSLTIKNTIHNWCHKKIFPFYNDTNTNKTDIELEILYLNNIDEGNKIETLLNLPYNTRNIVVVQFIRLPLNIIMSGYEFHKRTLAENWLKIVLTILGMKHRSQYVKDSFPTTQILLNNSITNDINDIIEILKQNPYERSKFCYNLPEFLQINWTKSNYNYSFEFALKSQWKTRGWYRNIDHSDYGIFWEFIRYYNCEWYHMYLKYKLFTKLKLQKDLNINHISFALDSFFKGNQFEKNINLLLDTLNIIDNENNNRILKKYNVYPLINITQSRNQLYKTLKNVGNDVPDHHKTKGTYNKTLLRNKLFRVHTNVCSTVKNLTLLMNFTWNYAEQC
eukprot:157477_1